VELTFFAPWFFFLGIGAVDWGFYSYSLITVEAAARAAALYTSAADSAGACTIALGQLRQLPNVGSSLQNCNASPLQVTAEQVVGADQAAASRVTIIYRTIPLIPLPAFASGQVTINRAVEMKI
jgi:hypothetical protein